MRSKEKHIHSRTNSTVEISSRTGDTDSIYKKNGTAARYISSDLSVVSRLAYADTSRVI